MKIVSVLLVLLSVFNEMTPYSYEALPVPSAPAGYHEVYLSHYGRHGSRFDNKAHRLETLMQVFDNASKESVLTAKGDSLYLELQKIYSCASGHYGELLPLGESQHRGIASRMALRFSSLFNSCPGPFPVSSPVVCARSTSYQRCRESMNSFTGQLRSVYPSVQIDTLIGKDNDSILNFYNPARMDKMLLQDKNERLEQALKDCNSYLSLFFTDPATALFCNCSPSEFFDALFFVAGMCANLQMDVNLEKYLPSDLLSILGDVNEAYLFGFCARSTEFGAGRMSSCQTLCDDICSRADSALLGRGPAVDLRFGHDAPLLSLMCRLGVEGLQSRSMNDLDAFSISDFIPMAANLQLIFYRNQSDSDILLLCLVNEKAVKLRGLKARSDYFYSWKDVRERLGLMPVLRVENQSRHVQGIAYDSQEERFYLSFTTRLLICSKYGDILGSIDRIHGHLGALCFEPASRKIYASLECKDDAIGSSISAGLQEEAYSDSRFYIAVFEPDAIVDAASGDYALYEVKEAKKDYDSGNFGCSGIDAICIAEDKLLVAYGIYSDTTRCDNDNQVILRYSLSDLSVPEDKILIATGNTRYGVQNMAWNAQNGRLLLAVYPGQKKEYPNYSFFQVNLESGEVERAWHFPAAATGFCSAGGDLWYVAHREKDKKKEKSCREGARIVLHKWSGEEDAFVIQ